MPDYLFRCKRCGETVAIRHGIAEEHPKVHEGCGGELRQRYFPAGVVYKHSGFFKTDSILSNPEIE